MYTTSDLIQTCSACPEQYDLSGALIHLRHGFFTVYNDSGVLLYSTSETKSDGAFETQRERKEFLQKAVDIINADKEAYLNATFDYSPEAIQRFRGENSYLLENISDEQIKALLKDDETIKYTEGGRTYSLWVVKSLEDYSIPELVVN